mgnify:CR=1 FL=1
MTIEEIQKIIAKDEHRCLELKKTTGEIAQAVSGLYPAVEVKPEYIDVPGRPGDQLVEMRFDGWKWGQMRDGKVLNGFVTIVFRRPVVIKDDTPDDSRNGELNGELNKSQIATLEYIRQHGGCQAQEISEQMGVPFSTIDKHIRVLLERACIERRGSKKMGGYYVIEK